MPNVVRKRAGKRAASGPDQASRGRAEIVVVSGRKYLLDPDPSVGKPRIGIALHDLKAQLKRKVAEPGEGFAF